MQVIRFQRAAREGISRPVSEKQLTISVKRPAAIPAELLTPEQKAGTLYLIIRRPAQQIQVDCLRGSIPSALGVVECKGERFGSIQTDRPKTSSSRVSSCV
jgi:hypothetical protein